MMGILDILKQMKKANEPRLRAEQNKLSNPKSKLRESNLTNKQQYLRGLIGRRK